MTPQRISVALLVLSLALTACGTDGQPAEQVAPPPTPQSIGQAPQRLQWGQPGEVVGTNGAKLRITPIGLLFHRGPYKGVNGPENGWFVAIALKGEAISQAESVAAPITGGGFMWQGENAEKVGSSDGGASSTPWVGAVNEFSNIPIQPGEPEVGIETFDIPIKGGRLIYVNPADQSIVSWELPGADQGNGLEKVRARIKLFS